MKKIALVVMTFLLLTLVMTTAPLNVESQDVDRYTEVMGTLYDNRTGEPIPYGWVEIWASTWGQGVTCGSDGSYHFSFDVQIQETLDIMASKPGYYDQWDTFTIRKFETKIIDFYLTPMNISITGHVYDLETEETLGGAYVTLYSTEREGEDSWTRADEDGFFQFFTEPGDYKLKAYYQDYEPYQGDEFTVELGDDLVMDIYMEPMQSGIYGTVTDQDGQPVPDAYIRMYTPQWENYYSIYTDMEGYYEMKTVPGDYTIEVSVEGYMDYKDRVEIPEDNMVEYNPEIEEITISGVLKYIWEFIMEIIGGIV